MTVLGVVGVKGESEDSFFIAVQRDLRSYVEERFYLVDCGRVFEYGNFAFLFDDCYTVGAIRWVCE